MSKLYRVMLCDGMKSIQERKAKRSSVYSRLSELMRSFVPSVFIALFLLASGVGLIFAATSAEAITFEPVKTESVKVTGKIVDRYFFVEFNTLSFIDPVAAQYFISAFENQQIPYDGKHEPVASDKMTCSTSHCSYALEAPISEVPYIVGIGSSDSINTISATLSFVPGKSDGVPFNPSVSVAEIGINSVIVAYQMPLGYRPSDSKAWVGIWVGEASSTIPPMGKADVDSVQSDGTQGINGIKIQTDATYTVGFMSGPNSKDIVAIATIKTASY
ncbi:MAG: hypothetical protein COB30_019665 [Ectothiorhodospiraceae bacterium]|nr:hypothetical protein [Ectothiorhodospiraceae bacterium]